MVKRYMKQSEDDKIDNEVFCIALDTYAFQIVALQRLSVIAPFLQSPFCLPAALAF